MNRKSQVVPLILKGSTLKDTCRANQKIIWLAEKVTERSKTRKHVTWESVIEEIAKESNTGKGGGYPKTWRLKSPNR